MVIEEQKSLLQLNTLGFDQSAEYYCEPASDAELLEAITFAKDKGLPVSILGGGSNIVLTADVPGLTIRQRGNQVSFKTREDTTLVSADAGVNWHSLVQQCINRDLYGVENLSLIPGDTGAAPIQNIGAYGVELADVLDSVETIVLATAERRVFKASDCQFAYRDSIFKGSQRGKLVITGVTLRLSNSRRVNTSYGALSAELDRRGIDTPDARMISDAVVSIRQSKLPDPAIIGNAGSFFKNPVIDSEHYHRLQQIWHEMPAHPAGEHHVKVPAAWLIEATGWKGKRENQVGYHQDQPLVLVHYGNSTAAHLLDFATKIKQSVSKTFEIELEQEPVTFGFKTT